MSIWGKAFQEEGTAAAKAVISGVPGISKETSGYKTSQGVSDRR